MLLILFLLHATGKQAQSEIESILIKVMVVFVLAVILFTIVKFFALLFNFSTSKSIGAKSFNHVGFSRKKLNTNDIIILEKHFPYYVKLPKKSKATFEYRVYRFCKLKKFKGMDGVTITNEIKIFIAASAIQLTFGLRDFRFLHFDSIEIYPEKFFSDRGKAFHLGETDPREGTLRFSWYDFVKGYHIADDNRNLGLHEFSHALFLNYLSGKKDDVHFDQYYEVWKSEGSAQFFRLIENESNYIREYAQTNLMEFFAVCVECFFETPKKLFKYHPKIFNSIKKLLGQDPRILQNISSKKI